MQVWTVAVCPLHPYVDVVLPLFDGLASLNISILLILPKIFSLLCFSLHHLLCILQSRFHFLFFFSLSRSPLICFLASRGGCCYVYFLRPPHLAPKELSSCHSRRAGGSGNHWPSIALTDALDLRSWCPPGRRVDSSPSFSLM